MAATSPATHPELYKSIVVDGKPSPGVVTLSNCEREHDWEQQKPKGTIGAVTLNRGPQNSGPFTATFYFADEFEVEDWTTFSAALSASAESTKPRAMTIYHPDLARLKITSVVVKSVGILEHDGKNGATCKVQFLEYKPQKPRKPVPPAAKKALSAKNDPNAAAKAELDALLKQVNGP